jgi:hypothetical protein
LESKILGKNREPYEILGDAAASIVFGGIALLVKGTYNGVRHLNGRRVSDCAGGCGRKIQFNVKQHGEGPHYCEACADRIARQVPTGGIWERQMNITNPNYVMPGLNKTVAQLGGPGTRPAKHYPQMVTGQRRWYIHCIVFMDDGGHVAWNFDPNTNEVWKDHQRPDDLNEMR